MRLLAYLGLVLIVIANTSASSGYAFFSPSTNETIFANCYSDGALFSSTANLSIYYPNGSYLIENQTMTNYKTGQFQYMLETPADLGNYAVVVTCSDNIQSAGSFQIKELGKDVGMNDVAVLLGCAILTGSLFYLAYRHNKMPSMNKLFAPFIHMLGIWSISLPLLYISNTGILGAFGDTVMIIYIVIVIVYTALYSTITTLLLTGKLAKKGYDESKRGFNG